VTNRILDDLVAMLRPRRLTLTASFTPRGGISTIVTVVHEKSASRPATRSARSSRSTQPLRGRTRSGSRPRG
jgi:NADPH-dependent 7-cyano-7-deazaguanine reductase QueF